MCDLTWRTHFLFHVNIERRPAMTFLKGGSRSAAAQLFWCSGELVPLCDWRNPTLPLEHHVLLCPWCSLVRGFSSDPRTISFLLLLVCKSMSNKLVDVTGAAVSLWCFSTNKYWNRKDWLSKILRERKSFLRHVLSAVLLHFAAWISNSTRIVFLKEIDRLFSGTWIFSDRVPDWSGLIKPPTQSFSVMTH